MDTLKVYAGSIDERATERAVEALRSGLCIIYPTDTLYALGCDALNNRAVERLCALKGINPAKQQLSIVCSDLSQAAEYARIDNHAFKVLRHYLPGPYTFVLPASTSLPKVFKGRKTVGVRIPDCEISRHLAAGLGRPLLTTSVAVDDDRYDATDAESLAWHFETIAALALDGGEGATVPSTVVDLTDSADPRLLRQGAGDFE